MRITVNQLRKIIKEEVSSHLKRSRRTLREAETVDEMEDFLLEFTFVTPEDEEELEEMYPDYRDAGFVLVCDDPNGCANDFVRRVKNAPDALTDYEVQKGILIGGDVGVVIYGSPEQLTAAGHIFAKLDHEMGGGGFSFDPSEVNDIVREKMRQVGE